MGKVKTTWLLPGHSGRACNHEDIYTKQDKKTNKVYSVKLCNPNDDWNDAQVAHRNKFGTICSAISAWIKENKDKNTDDYKKVLSQYERQSKYGTLRGMIYGKRYASIDDSGNVTIKIGNSTSTVTGGGGTSSGGSGGTSGGDEEETM